MDPPRAPARPTKDDQAPQRVEVTPTPFSSPNVREDDESSLHVHRLPLQSPYSQATRLHSTTSSHGAEAAIHASEKNIGMQNSCDKEVFPQWLT